MLICAVQQSGSVTHARAHTQSSVKYSSPLRCVTGCERGSPAAQEGLVYRPVWDSLQLLTRGSRPSLLSAHSRKSVLCPVSLFPFCESVRVLFQMRLEWSVMSRQRWLFLTCFASARSGPPRCCKEQLTLREGRVCPVRAARLPWPFPSGQSGCSRVLATVCSIAMSRVRASLN